MRARKVSRRRVSSETLTRWRPAASRSAAKLGEAHAVRGHGEVDPERGEQLEEAGQLAPDGRLAAGDPDGLEAEALDADPGDPGLLLVGEELGAVEPGQALLGHAVGAAEVAAVGDRDPQVLDPAAERVDQRNGTACMAARIRPPAAVTASWQRNHYPGLTLAHSPWLN